MEYEDITLIGLLFYMVIIISTLAFGILIAKTFNNILDFDSEIVLKLMIKSFTDFIAACCTILESLDLFIRQNYKIILFILFIFIGPHLIIFSINGNK